MTTSTRQVGQHPVSSAIPIIIGVTGHRDLRAEDIPELEQRVGKIFQGLRTQYPDTALLVLSPLAEGADRLVARVALAQGTELVVPLPLPRVEYAKDFITRQSKTEFEKRLGQAAKSFELPLMSGNTLENIQHDGPHRDKQYTQVGAYIVRHSQILIALWDGVESGLEGGTAQIVQFKLEGIPEPYALPHNPLDAIDTGPVYHILTPRVKNPQPAGDLFSLCIKFPKDSEDAGSLQRSYDRILEQMNTFNRDAKRLVPKLTKNIEKNTRYVIPEEQMSTLPDIARAILDQYGVADTLAIHFQSWRRGVVITLFVIALLAVISFEVYAHLLGEPWVLALYPVTLGAAFLLYFLARQQAFHHKHLDYRALAEGLRVQLFWHLAGLSDAVADHYLRKQRTELEWIRHAIRAWNVPAIQSYAVANSGVSIQASAQDHVRSLQELVFPYWIKDQCKYFEGATKRDHTKLKRHEHTANWLFGFGLLFAIAVVFLHARFHDSKAYSHWHHWLIVIMGTAPAIAAAMGGYAEKMAFSAQAKRYRWMNILFARASVQLQAFLKRSELKEAQQLILDLGKEALEENGDWVSIHRERTLEVPRG